MLASAYMMSKCSFLRPFRVSLASGTRIPGIFRQFSAAPAARGQALPNSASSPPPGSSQPPSPSWETSEEPLEDYDPSSGGYCPIALGDVLGSHFKVVLKLGWGMYSTVWLAQDQRTASLSYSALKVMARIATDAQGNQLHELKFLEHMRVQSPHHPGYAHIAHLRDHFHHDGPNGSHLCLVMEPLLEDLRLCSMRWKHRLMPLSMVRLLARQIVLGLQYLHEECNIVHTDIKPANLLLVPPEDRMHTIFPDVVRETPTETSVAQLPDGSSVTRVCSNPIMYPLPDLGRYDPMDLGPWRGTQVKLGDVGVACYADKVSEHYTDLIQSPALRAPEVALGAGWGKPADIWSLGCTLYELYMGRSLLKADIDPMSVPLVHTIIFGDYPRPLVQRGKHRDVFYKPDGTLKISAPERMPFDLSIRKRNAPDAALFADFLARTFVLEPALRATCRDLLDHPWLNA